MYLCPFNQKHFYKIITIIFQDFGLFKDFGSTKTETTIQNEISFSVINILVLKFGFGSGFFYFIIFLPQF